ncbi:MAG TPA: polysaccharide biosynthesis protein [Cytophagales bacterium]|nr:polysaccharide biosynthesis protein [Cytophagales bacterium]
MRKRTDVIQKFIYRLPKYLVLQVDVLICLLSVLVAYFLRYNLESLPTHVWIDIYTSICVICSVKLISFFYFKSYTGIIRYTSVEDAKRIFYSLTSSFIALSAINLGLYLYFGHLLIPTSILIIDFLASTLFMASFRIVAKISYYEWQTQNVEKINVIIYGAGQAGIITKKTLDQDTSMNYNVVAFVDDKTSKSGGMIDGVTIYSARKKLEEIIKTKNVELVIIAIQKVSSERKKKIIDTCLSYGVQIRNVPPVEKWINGELSLKQIKDVKIEDVLGREAISLDNTVIKEELNKKRILVTGAAGSIGSELCRQIAHFSPSLLIMVDQSESALYDIDMEFQDQNFKCPRTLILADVRNMQKMEKVFEMYKPEVVFHAAAYKHVPVMEQNPSEAVHTNILGTRILADLSIKHMTKKFIMISTDKAVNPTSVMGASKRVAEIYIQSLNSFSIDGNSETSTRFITTRFGNVLGSNGSVIPRFKKQIAEGGPITVTHPEITRYFMTIPEASQLVLEASAIGKGGEIFLFDMGESIKIVDLAKKMIKLSGLILGKDIQLVFSGLRPGEKLYEELLNNEENTLPTHHPKIMIAKVRHQEFNQVKEDMAKLMKYYDKGEEERMVMQMKQMVPEYKSNNSVFEKFDEQKDKKALNLPVQPTTSFI